MTDKKPTPETPAEWAQRVLAKHGPPPKEFEDRIRSIVRANAAISRYCPLADGGSKEAAPVGASTPARALTDPQVNWRTIVTSSMPDPNVGSIRPTTQMAIVRSDEPATLPRGWTMHRTADLPSGVNAATRWSDQTIWLDERIEGPEARFVLEHELQHALRGPAEERGISVELDEHLCDLAAAARLSASGMRMDAAWTAYYTEQWGESSECGAA